MVFVCMFFIICQTMAIDWGAHLKSSTDQQCGHFMASSLLVSLQSAKGVPLRRVWFLHRCAHSVSVSVHLFGSSLLRVWTLSLCPGPLQFLGCRYVTARAIANCILRKQELCKRSFQAQMIIHTQLLTIPVRCVTTPPFNFLNFTIK